MNFFVTLGLLFLVSPIFAKTVTYSSAGFDPLSLEGAEALVFERPCGDLSNIPFDDLTKIRITVAQDPNYANVEAQLNNSTYAWQFRVLPDATLDFDQAKSRTIKFGGACQVTTTVALGAACPPCACGEAVID